MWTIEITFVPLARPSASGLVRQEATYVSSSIFDLAEVAELDNIL